MSSMLTMSEADRQAFLAETHVGVLSIARGDGRPPLASPVWYVYDEGGDVLVNIGAASAKAAALATTPAASLTVQTESLPYKFVTVGGPVAVGPADDATRRRIAERYLPAEMVDGYLASSGDPAQMLTIRLTPRTWHSNDFGQLG
jgi:PPOX class probable F420-dependent enzyme